ncbi:YwmB family TATA-box binding protein [Paenibacillus sp. FSL L8-0470]|uniref:YwmB family TATA-box binding protein n=1 Tax=Paenibacillus sp. FSL L8-0470 TaxID=2954688 RepID=UPI0030FAABC9
MKLRNRGRGKATLALLFMCIAALLLAGFRSGAGGEAVTASAAADVIISEGAGLEQGLELLVTAGRKSTEPGSSLRLVLKWQGEYSGNAAESAKAAAGLAERLGLGTPEHSEEDGHTTFRAAASFNPSGKTSLFWSGIDQSRSYVIVTLETADLLKATAFQAAAQEAGVQMQAAGIEPEWNVSLQGVASTQGTPREALVHTEQAIAAAISGLQAVEDYEDETTYSRSYSVPGLARYVSSGKHAVAMQTAVHKNGNNNSNRVTIGLPLITIEY